MIVADKAQIIVRKKMNQDKVVKLNKYIKMKNIKVDNRAYLEIVYLNLIKERDNLIEKIKKNQKKFFYNSYKKLSSSESDLLRFYDIKRL